MEMVVIIFVRVLVNTVCGARAFISNPERIRDIFYYQLLRISAL